MSIHSVLSNLGLRTGIFLRSSSQGLPASNSNQPANAAAATSTASQADGTSYDLHNVTNAQMWELARKEDVATVKMYVATHPTPADGSRYDITTDTATHDFHGLMQSYAQSDRAAGDKEGANEWEHALTKLTTLADDQGVITLSDQVWQTGKGGHLDLVA